MNDTQSLDNYLKACIAHPGQSHVINAGGNRIHYLEWAGPVAAPTLVLLHGFLGHAHWWDFVAPALAENYRVVALDLGGMGDSGHRESYSFETYVAEITEAVAQTCHEPITLIGHSFGGRCAIQSTCAMPQLIKHLIVIDSKIGFPKLSAERPTDFGALIGRTRTRYPSIEAAKARFRMVPEEPDAHAVVLDHIANHSLRQDGDAWIWKFDPVIVERGPSMGIVDSPFLSQLKVPTDYIRGEHSIVVTKEHAQQIMREVKQGRGPIEVPAAHHHIPTGQPATMVALIRALLL